MSRRKGVSAEEKRKRMMELFYEKKEVFQLKELEKIAPKEKGIIAQSVKDVVQGLVDDNLVDTDKIGTSIYYWSFPSKAGQIRKSKLKDLEESLAKARKRLKTVEDNLKSIQNQRNDTDERREILKTLENKKAKLAQVKAELEIYRENDPEVLKELKKNAEAAKEAANRWTDNVFSIKSWCKKKFFVEETQLDKQFGIPEDFDYVE